MTGSHTAKLSAMMFLEFFIWGAWLPQVFGYLPSLGFGSTEVSWILNAFTIGSFTALFFGTQFADRRFEAQRFVAASHLVGGLAILALTWTKSFWPFLALMLVHSLFYVPTISVTNAIAFAHVRDPKREFGLIRLWGTIGWIAASLPFVFVLVDWDKVPPLAEAGLVEWLGTALATPLSGAALQAGRAWTFFAAGVASLLLAALSTTLPRTPPKPAVAGESLAWLEAVRLLRKPFLGVLFVVTFCDAAVHQGYFVMTNSFLIDGVGIPANWAPQVMTLGQVAEIATMAVLGLVLKKLGWRTTMTIGVLGHAMRFWVFAFFPVKELVVASILLHGICYAFFFATVYIFVDEVFPKDARSSAQGLFNVLILGFGPFVGNFVWPELMAACTTPENVVDFRAVFMVPSAAALGAALFLFLFFRPPHASVDQDSAA